MSFETESFNPDYDAAMAAAREINATENALSGAINDRDDALYVLKESLGSIKRRLQESIISVTGNAKIDPKGVITRKIVNDPANFELQRLLMQDIELRRKQIKALGGQE